MPEANFEELDDIVLSVQKQIESSQEKIRDIQRKRKEAEQLPDHYGLPPVVTRAANALGTRKSRTKFLTIELDHTRGMLLRMESQASFSRYRKDMAS